METRLKPVVNGTKVLFTGRLAYCHLFEKHSMGENDEGKYQTGVIIPKDDTETVEALKSAIRAARTEGVTSRWKGKEPAKLTIPLQDGDEKEGEEFHAAIYLNPKSSRRVDVVDVYKKPIEDPETVYSGCYAALSVNFFPYDSNGNKGVGAGLNAVMKLADGERLGGNSGGAADFDAMDIPRPKVDSLDDF